MSTWCLRINTSNTNSSDTGDTEEEENHNTWNALLAALTMLGFSPAIQQSPAGLGVRRVAWS